MDGYDGLEYKIHEAWGDQVGDSNSAFGLQSCQAKAMGGTFDPTLACSDLSGSLRCARELGFDSKNACVSSSSADVENTEGRYTCTPENFAQNPYVCEVGDLSGKLGLYNPFVSSEGIAEVHYDALLQV